ncbi:MAG: hypothetical protein HC837_12945 [Chloroflexaceae bacterium]|nr:hypothetical protein [Chloroflexaceae bacterium]
MIEGEDWPILAPDTLTALAPGEGSTWPLRVAIPADTPIGRSAIFTVTVTSDEDSAVTDMITLTTRAAKPHAYVDVDLRYEQPTAMSLQRAGDALPRFSLTLTNTGPDAIDVLDVTLAISNIGTFSAVQGDGWTCQVAEQQVECQLSRLDVDDVSVLTIELEQTTENGPTRLTAQLSSPNTDIFLANGVDDASANTEIMVHLHGQPQVFLPIIWRR